MGTSTASQVDWDALRASAVQAAASAYCPYSHLQVGAAAIVDDGRLITGCNVENASYGLGPVRGVHPGRAAAADRRRPAGGAWPAGRVTGELLMPCGRCRQVIYEFGGPDLLLDTPEGVRPMTWVLPAAFGPEHLPS